jgi:large conductance mechanosensitive channel
MLKEFREFILRGNVLELAVGIIIGAAFSAVVGSLVNDVLMPPIGYLMGGVDFSDLFITLSDAPEGGYPSLQAAKDAGAATINYGVFLNAIINFLIVAAAVFFLLKAVNRAMAQFKKEEEAAAPAEPTAEEKLTAAIEKLTAVMEKKA